MGMGTNCKVGVGTPGVKRVAGRTYSGNGNACQPRYVGVAWRYFEREETSLGSGKHGSRPREGVTASTGLAIVVHSYWSSRFCRGRMVIP